MSGKIKGEGMSEARGSLLKDALQRIRELRSRVEELERGTSDPVAIVGMGCRFPGRVHSPGEFWTLLSEKRDAVTEIPPDRWSIDRFYDPDPDVPGKMSTRFGAFLDGVDRFDARFFGISPLEAGSIDPQQRLLLEVCWEALEDAGCAADSLMGTSGGVFVGIGSNDYALLRAKRDRPEEVDDYLALGTVHSVAAGRIAYVLGVQGPCMAIDTACSSSLVAVHLAIRSLRSGECRMAVAGGVGVILAPEYYINFSKARMLAPDGRCKTFDAAADGYVRGEGCGMVVLKKLSDAQSDGDRILAVIRGTAINQDGRSSGLTAPNGLSQEAVIRAALADAGVPPGSVDYVEAHGTGTSLGDPIELGALGAALCGERTRANPLRVGSVKTNIGHLEGAAGMAGLIKTVLSLENGTIPPQLHFRTPNPYVDWARWPIEVVTEPSPWPRGEKPRFAGVSSFGFSGTNAHVILEEAPSAGERGRERSTALVAISGKSEEARGSAAERLASHLSLNPEVRIGDVARTLNAGRVHHPFRSAIVAGSCTELEDSLRALSANRPDGRTRSGYSPTGESPEVVFLFTGQGAQHPDMGRTLYDSSGVFRTELDRCASILSRDLDRPLLELLYGDAREKLYETCYAQPATFAFEYALASQWQAWGIKPSAVMGHSLGEYVAACIGGALDLEDALKLVATRGRLMHDLPRGAMAAILAPEGEVKGALAGWPGVSIAAVNSRESVVISGEEAGVAAVCDRLSGQGITCKPVRVAQGAHSRLVEPMLDALERAARHAKMRDPEIELVSNVTAVPVRPGEFDPSYWKRHARSQVRFAEGLRGLYERGYRVFLEIGPRTTLTGFVEEELTAPDVCGVASLRPGSDDWREMLDGLGVLYSRGVPVDWPELDRGYDHRKIDLPTYPFERERYWFSGAPEGTDAAGTREDLWESCLRKTRLQAEQAPFDLFPESFPRIWAAFERLTLAYQAGALEEIGAFRRKGETFTPEALCKSFGIPPTYSRLMRRWMDHLSEAGMLKAEGSEFRADRPLSSPPLDPLLREASEESKAYPEFYEYVQSCGPRLASVLTGKQSPLDTLFPQGSFDLADGLYHRSAVSRYLNAMVRAALEAAARDVTPTRPLRILEIGAGTGGTTAALLPWLDPMRTRYVFTDVSDLFLNRAMERFTDFPFVQYSRLDIDRDPREQGFPEGSFDVVIAANVLHATRDLGGTIDRVAMLLAEGGILVLSETTAHPRVFDITTGLIEGWQAFDDSVRRDNPLVSADRWVEMLTERGFRAASAFPEGSSPATNLGNHVLIAARPGERSASGQELPAGAGNPEGRVPVKADISREFPEAGGACTVEELLQYHPAERRERLTDCTRDVVAKILRLDERRKPNLRDRLMDLGFDSLMAVQLRNRLSTMLGLQSRLPATLVFDYPTCEDIGNYLAGLLGGGDAASGKGVPPTGDVPAGPERREGQLREDLDRLTEGEAEAALLLRLEKIEGKTR